MTKSTPKKSKMQGANAISPAAKQLWKQNAKTPTRTGDSPEGSYPLNTHYKKGVKGEEGQDKRARRWMKSFLSGTSTN